MGALFYVAIDDTDNLESRGTGHQVGGLAGGAGALLAGTVVQGDPMKSIGLALAGLLIDGLIYLARRGWGRFLLITLAGGLGNGAVLVTKLIGGDVPKAVLKQGLLYGFSSYIGFGLLGGLIVALASLSLG